ncbi:MAG: RIP metalloprotease RseP [Candidatus Bipolaricaulota bacterium]|nr:RIP metalloprotease RseP [Candidatus Bipolaricaulota bacterium]
MITLFIFAGTILVLIGVHEGGHFLAAKLLGIAVEEFAVGFGPAIWSRKRGETRYSVRAFPFGGFVRLAGESAEATEVPLERTYYGARAWKRFFLSLAGPVANALLAVAVVLGAVLGLGLPRPQVAGLVPGKPAADALQVGDVVLAVGGKPAWATGDVGAKIRAVAPEPVPFRIRRGGVELEVVVRPVFDPEESRYLVGAYFLPQILLPELDAVTPGGGWSRLGYLPGDRVLAACGEEVRSFLDLYARWEGGCREALVDRDGERRVLPLPETGEALAGDAAFRATPPVYERPPWGEGIALALGELGQAVAGFVATIRGLLTRTLPAGEAVSGPVGIAALLGQGVRAGPLAFLLLVALISLNLALFNLVPFPALDGSRMAFALYETVTRRKVSPRVEMAVHAAGFAILLGVLLLITLQDLRRLFG